MYLCLLSLALILGANAVPKNVTHYPIEEVVTHFEEFIITYGKHYANEQEKAKRLEIFKDNLKKVNRLNKESKHAVFGITKAMDLTKEEFKKIYTGLKIGHMGLDERRDDDYCKVKTDSDISNGDAPESLDYRTKGYVTAVKDQSSCGSCYAFSAIGQIEGQYAKVHGSLQEFSEQQILDCDRISNGCSDGIPSASFKELIRMGGSMTEEQYPYTASQSQCRVDSSKIVAKVVDCATYHITKQETLKQLLHQVGPVSIAIKSDILLSYTGGIITDSQCVGKIDHAVLLVGYGSENGMDYWLIKNSWGTDHDDKGYARVERNRSSGIYGPCGIMHPLMATATVA